MPHTLIVNGKNELIVPSEVWQSGVILWKPMEHYRNDRLLSLSPSVTEAININVYIFLSVSQGPGTKLSNLHPYQGYNLEQVTHLCLDGIYCKTKITVMPSSWSCFEDEVKYSLSLDIGFDLHACWCQSLGHVQVFVPPWTAACQAPLRTRILKARIPE